jgi:hypothetical protein
MRSKSVQMRYCYYTMAFGFSGVSLNYSSLLSFP